MLPSSPAFPVHTSCIAQVRESHHPEQTGILTFSASIQTAEHGEVKNTCVSWLRSRESYPIMLWWTVHAPCLFSCHFPGWLNPSLGPDCFIHPLAPLTLFFSIDNFVLRVFKEIVTDAFSHFFFHHSGQEFKETEPSSKESVLKRCEGTQGHLIQETQSTVLQTVTQRRSSLRILQREEKLGKHKGWNWGQIKMPWVETEAQEMG